MVKILGNRFEPHNNVIKFEIYEPSDDGYDLRIVGDTRKFQFIKSCTVQCEVLSEQQLRNLGLINADLLKLEINRDGSATVMVTL